MIVDDYIFSKVLDKIKKVISIEKFDDTKSLIDIDDKLSVDFTLKNMMILITCIIKNDGKFYPQIFLEEVLVA